MNILPKQSSLLDEALQFLEQMAQETNNCPQSRITSIKQEIDKTGLWTPNTNELLFGTKLAWRNNTRCIGRRYWEGLEVRDMRHLDNEADIAQAAIDHVKIAYNKGKLKPVCTIFQPHHKQVAPRFWNHQIIRYAGYRQPDGSVIGEPMSIAFTEKIAEVFGWKGAGTHFDVLPLVVHLPNRPPQLFEIPTEATYEVEITHPDFEWFADLGLKWYAVPALCDMAMELGGIQYTAAPFSGWYMSTEIASRNFGDTSRYNLLPTVADRMGLSQSSNRTLWKDRALLELNAAVLHSFEKANVTLHDHHTASQDFIRFQEKEARCERPTHADWAWIVPPMSSSACPVFHEEYQNKILRPNFFYQEAPF